MLANRFKSTVQAPFGWPDLSWLPFLESNTRVEEFIEDDRYVVRFELPGVDLKDVEVTYVEGMLRLSYTRTQDCSEECKEKGLCRSEFHFGSFHRTITLPPGVKQDTFAATYCCGVLEIKALVGEPTYVGKQIPIKFTDPAITKS